MSIPRHLQVDAQSGELSVGTPTLESGFGAIDIEFSANAGVTAEAIGVMAADVEGKVSTERTTRRAALPRHGDARSGEPGFPDFVLPTWDMRGRGDRPTDLLSVERRVVLGRATAPPCGGRESRGAAAHHRAAHFFP